MQVANDLVAGRHRGDGRGRSGFGHGGTLARRVVVGAVAAAMVGAPAFLASASASSSPSPVPVTTSVDAAPESAKATFTVGIVEDVDSLNPFTGINAEAYEAWGMMYDYLIGYSQKDFSPVPGLATEWKESPDHTTWTYTIRSGVKWSDGVPLTSADVAYTFNRILKGTYEQTNYGNYVAGITSVTAPDPTTVVMKVKSPSPIMTRLAIPILPQHIWKDISESKVKSFSNEPSSGHPVVGSGPFVLTSHSKNQFLRFKANPNYFLGAPKVGEVDLRWFGSQEPMTQALRSGEIDMVDALDAGPFNSLKGVSGITSVAAQYSGFDEFAFNTGAALADGTPIGNGNPALKDKAFRIAVSHAVDKATLLARSLQGRGELGSSIIPTIYPNLHYDPGTTAITYDVAEANKELDAAGYPKGSNGIRTGKDGKPINLRLFARTESQTSKAAINFLQGWLKDIGIASTVKVMSNDTLTEVIGQGNYDIFHWGWVVEPDPDYQLSTFTCDKRSYKDAGQIYADLSDSFYCNKAYDALYAQQAKTTDPDARAEIVKRMEKMVYDDAPYIVTDYYDDLEAYRSDKWGNVQAQPVGNGVLVFQYGTYTYRNVELQTDIAAAAAAASSAAASGSAPAASGSASPSSDSGGGSSAWIWILVAVAAIAVVGGAFLMGRRKGASAEDDEE